MPPEFIEIIDNDPGRMVAGLSAKSRRSKPVEGYIEIVDREPSATLANVEEDQPSTSTAKASCETTLADLKFDLGDTLPECQTIDEVRAWLLDTQRSFSEKVIRGYARRRVHPDIRLQADEILGRSGAIEAYTLADNILSLEAFEKLRGHLSSYVSRVPENEIGICTFIDGCGGTSMNHPVIEVRKSRKLVNNTMRKIAPHWIGLVDLAFFWTIQHPDGGLHLQRHEHVICWGPDFIDKANRALERLSAKFQPNVTDAPVIKIARGWDTSEVNLARLAAYLLKAPAKGKNFFRYPDGKVLMNHTEKKDRFIQFLRLAQLRSMLSLEDIVLAGGNGVKIKGSMIKDMRDLAEISAHGKAAMHPDMVPTFWTGFNDELGQTQWSTPAILRR